MGFISTEKMLEQLENQDNAKRLLLSMKNGDQKIVWNQEEDLEIEDVLQTLNESRWFIGNGFAYKSEEVQAVRFLSRGETPHLKEKNRFDAAHLTLQFIKSRDSPPTQEEVLEETPPEIENTAVESALGRLLELGKVEMQTNSNYERVFEVVE